jgi:hypothetical protein
MLRKKPDRCIRPAVDPGENQFCDGVRQVMKNAAVCLVVMSALGLAGCKQQQAPGIYVEISLKNDTDIDKYVLFNPNIKTIEECENTFAASLPDIMANLPQAIPKNSTATGWKCFLKDPTKKK